MASTRGLYDVSAAGPGGESSGPAFALVAVGSRPEEAWLVNVLGMDKGDILDNFPPFTRFQPWLHGVNLNDCRVSVVVNAGGCVVPATGAGTSLLAAVSVLKMVRDVELQETRPLVGKVRHRKVTVIGDQPYVHIRIQLPPPVAIPPDVVLPRIRRELSAYTGPVTARLALWEWSQFDTIPAWMPLRVVTGNRAPVPLALVHAAFGDFADALKADPSSAAVATANDLVDAVDAFFASPEVEEAAFKDDINRVLSGLLPAMMRMPQRACATDGTVLAAPFDLPILNLVAMTSSDPTAVNEATYLRLVTGASSAVCHVSGRLHMHSALLAALPTLPCFLLSVHSGSVLEVRGAALVGAGMISEPLAVASLRGICDGPGADALARLLHACVVGVSMLTAAYAALARDASPFVPVMSPSLASLIRPLTLADGRRVKCTRDLSSEVPRLVFEAVELPPAASAAAAAAAAAASLPAGGGSTAATTAVVATGVPECGGAAADDGKARLLAVKLIRGRYGSEVHALVAAAGHAPALLSVTPLTNRLTAVAMDLLDVREGAWQLYYAVEAPAATKAAVTAAYLHAFTRDSVEYVHGDLRYGNVFIRTDAATGCVSGVMFIDFEWAGRAGEARYPANMNTDVWMCGGLVGTKPGSLIPRAHDLHWLAGNDAPPRIGS